MQLLGADRGRQLGAQKVIVELDQRVSEGVAQRVNNFGRDIFWNRSATVHLIHPFSPKFNLRRSNHLSLIDIFENHSPI